MERPGNEQSSEQSIESRRADELRQYILNTLVKPDEYYQKGEEALYESGRGMGEGVYFKGKLIGYSPSQKAHEAIKTLSSEVKRAVTAHGIASNVPLGLSEEQMKKFPLFALLQILATGEVKGDCEALEVDGNLPVGVFDTAPFILLSNKYESLLENDPETGTVKLKNLRTILINGQYEAMVDDLKKRFPGVSFRTAEQINDAVFDTKSDVFKSFDDQIREKILDEMRSK